MIKIIGAKGNIQNVDSFLGKIIKYRKEKELIIQAFNADVIYGKEHLASSFKHAKRAFKNKTNSTNSLEMEILLYSSGERQLKLAIPKMGVVSGNSNIAFIFIKEKDILTDRIIDEFLVYASLKRDDKVLLGNADTLKKFGIKKNEIKTVTKDKYGHLILEKVARVDIIK
jgi:tRNA threonylcarbamoyladenosine modification (KEOPS) complex Cgi121 subunit